MVKMRSLSMILSGSLLVSGIAYADFGDALVGGVVGGAVGSVITNEVYNSNRQQQQSQPKRTHKTYKKKKYHAPKMTDEKRIQKALSSLGFYRGRIDGEVNSFETRSAIKDMNIAYEISNSASLKPEAKDTLIFLGTLFELDRYLIARNNDKRTKSKKIQAALKIHGYYYGKIDGAIGKGTRGSIAEYKGNNGMSYSGSLDFEEEYQLISSAKAKNDKNIEDAIASLKALGVPKSQHLQQNQVIKLQPTQ
ncbi:MAG: peptidoglycan-binding protein [Epsilonproteobacteria bacterium 4484_65]|nr:MAG: peptidoglycan-binding protein [Epsilonproteobacteria bacterium 4484_65]